MIHVHRLKCHYFSISVAIHSYLKHNPTCYTTMVTNLHNVNLLFHDFQLESFVQSSQFRQFPHISPCLTSQAKKYCKQLTQLTQWICLIKVHLVPRYGFQAIVFCAYWPWKELPNEKIIMVKKLFPLPLGRGSK